MSRPRLVLASGVAAGVAAHYFLLEKLLADRTDSSAGWISDLGARSESTGLIFDLLDFVAGALILTFALVIRPQLAGRSGALRWGVAAMIAMGVCSMLDGALPLSCAESLTQACDLRYDAVDLIHGAETFVSIAATVAAFGFLALGFREDEDDRLRRLGAITAVAGVLWVLCNILMGAQYLLEDLDEVKGIFHRASQVILGVWLVAMAVNLRGLSPPRGAKPSPGLGRIEGDGEATEPIHMP
jgi:hypothetical protein